MRDAFVQELTLAAALNPQIMLITGDLGFGVLTNFAKQFPKQFLNAGVAEQNMAALACGMALEGRKVFTYSIGNFPTLRCLEQIRNDICYHEADVTVVAVGGGFSYGQLGVSHFATEDLAILRTLPGMRVVAPSGIWEASQATRTLIEAGGPSYLRLDKGAADSGPRPGEIFELGKARQFGDGSDVCLVASGAILSEVLKAADSLKKEGLSARVLSVHTLKPFDRDAILSAVRQCRGIVSMEEHTVIGGLGTAIAETCLDAGVVPAWAIRMGLNDQFPSIVGDQNYLRHEYRMDAEAVLNCIRNVTAAPDTQAGYRQCPTVS